MLLVLSRVMASRDLFTSCVTGKRVDPMLSWFASATSERPWRDCCKLSVDSSSHVPLKIDAVGRMRVKDETSGGNTTVPHD
jgi:hypothetical protein